MLTLDDAQKQKQSTTKTVVYGIRSIRNDEKKKQVAPPHAIAPQHNNATQQRHLPVAPLTQPRHLPVVPRMVTYLRAYA